MKKNKFLILLLFVFILSSTSWADTVILKNGSKMEGEIEKLDNGDYILKKNGMKVTILKSEVYEIKLSPKDPSTTESSDSFYKIYLEVLSILKKNKFNAAYVLANSKAIAHLDSKLFQKTKDFFIKSKEARTYLFSARYEKAIEKYEEIIRTFPELGQTVYPFYSKANAVLTDRYFNKKDWGQCLNYGVKAIQFDNNILIQLKDRLLQSALVYTSNSIKEKKYKTAITYLRQLQYHFKKNKYFIRCLGDLYISNSQYELAYDLYAKASNITKPYSGKASDVISIRNKFTSDMYGVKINFLIRPLNIEPYDRTKIDSDKWMILLTPHFKIHFKNTEIGYDASHVVEYYYSKLCKDLAGEQHVFPFKDKINLYIHSNKNDFMKEASLIENTGVHKVTWRNDKIHNLEIHTFQTTHEPLLNVIPHEITHVIMRLLLGSKAIENKGFHEGPPTLIEEPAFKQARLNVLKEYRKKKNLNWDLLINSKDYPNDYPIMVFYAQALVFADFFAKQKDLKTYIYFINSIKLLGFDRALKDTYGYADKKKLWDDIEKFINTRNYLTDD